MENAWNYGQGKKKKKKFVHILFHASSCSRWGQEFAEIGCSQIPNPKQEGACITEQS